MSKNNISFTEWLDNNWERDNIFCPNLDAQLALNFLKDYLLGEDWCVIPPLNQGQINAEIVNEVLLKFSKEYRKEIKSKKQKEI